MEPIVSKKGKVALSERTTLQNVYVNVTVSFKKETVINEGTDTEEVIGTQYPTENVQAQFEADQASEAGRVDIAGMLNQAIDELKSKAK